jgi:diguanylate cyclase (GGDEF)-like protein
MKTLAGAGLAYIFLFLGLTAHADPRALSAQLQRAEQLGWFDAEASLASLETLEPQIQDPAAELELLTLRGFADVDSKRDEDARQVLEHLHGLESSGSRAAGFARHIIRAYLLRQSDQYEAARAELDAIDPNDLRSDLERYRLEYLRGCVLRFLGQHEAALRAFERALDIAHTMHSVPYAIHTMLTSSQFLLRIGNLDRAAAQLREAKNLAQQIGDEASLVTILHHESDIASRRGDHAAELSGMVEALGHARNVGSPLLLALAYSGLGDAYLNVKDFVTSLSYSKQALAFAPKVRRNGFEQTVRFNIAIAQIGLGHVAEGKRVVEREIAAALDTGNVVDAEESLREYAAALEAAHDWHAVEVLQRDAQLRDQLMNTARQQALLELSAKFDAERKARQIDLLTRDNALKSAELRAQRTRQQLILAGALLAVAMSLTLGWAFRGVRRANRQLRFNSEHDPLTGLPNRRYFNDHVLTRPASQFEGCVLIVDIDHFKRINDLFGHLAGDHVLACVGKRLATTLRGSDTLVRWGGEEFLAVLPRLTDAQLAMTARRLLESVSAEPIEWQGQTIRCTVSIGYASFPMRGATGNISLSRALSLADEALYQAKRGGRNRACGVPTAAELLGRFLQPV